MKFALNYSRPAAQLLREGKIEVDLFKCPLIPEIIQEASGLKPFYVHFPIQAGQREIKPELVASIRKYLQTSETIFINAHFSTRFQNVTNPENADEVVEAALSDINFLAAHFEPGRFIIENIPRCPDNMEVVPLVTSPAVISTLLERSGCGLLLDIAHARLAAEALGMPVQEYILKLPVDRIREVHVTGVQVGRQGYRIDHEPMTEDDWELLEWTLQEIHSGCFARPEYVTCEYGGVSPGFDSKNKPEVIAAEIPRMSALVKSLLK